MKPCEGYPPGHVCPVQVPDDRMWCSGCRETRQREELAAEPVAGMSRVGVILEDFEAVRPACPCGGDISSPHHTDSLTHRRWAWSTGQHLETEPVYSIRKVRAMWEKNAEAR